MHYADMHLEYEPIVKRGHWFWSLDQPMDISLHAYGYLPTNITPKEQLIVRKNNWWLDISLKHMESTTRRHFLLCFASLMYSSLLGYKSRMIYLST